jgi:hypothetical protein
VAVQRSCRQCTSATSPTWSTCLPTHAALREQPEPRPRAPRPWKWKTTFSAASISSGKAVFGPTLIPLSG